MDDILKMIALLISKGLYVSRGSVWYAVTTFGDYGKLSGQKIDELRSSDSAPGKQHPADFALWKGVKPGEPSWDSPWGPGRPGWHIECSAMIKCCIGEQIDIHGGGIDLVFPHHENEIAQSEGANGKALRTLLDAQRHADNGRWTEKWASLLEMSSTYVMH